MSHYLQKHFDQARADRARASHVAASADKKRRSEMLEIRLQKAMLAQGVPTAHWGGQKPFDNLGEWHRAGFAVEVKLVTAEARNAKLTMHGGKNESLAKKKKYAKLNHVIALTAAFHEGHSQWYVKEGVGSFRLGSMKKARLANIAPFIKGVIRAHEQANKIRKQVRPWRVTKSGALIRKSSSGKNVYKKK